MASETVLELRPRTTGEILDDAWRLALADAPSLLLLDGLFLAPAFAVALLSLTVSPDSSWSRWLPALAALLGALTGIGAGACQQWLRHRAEGGKPSLAGCLADALRRAPAHAAVRGLMLAGMLAGPVCFLLATRAEEAFLIVVLVVCGVLLSLAGLALWIGFPSVHAILAAGTARPGAGLAEAAREATFHSGKTGATVLSRVPLLLLAVVNLHLLLRVALWTAANLAGLDTGGLPFELTFGNPVYVLSLVLFSWLLLAPFFEAANFLLHFDARTRREGLDLLYRVQRVFAPAARAPEAPRAVSAGRGRVLLILLTLGAGVLTAKAHGAPAPERPRRLSREEVKGLLRHEADEGRGAGRSGRRRLVRSHREVREEERERRERREAERRAREERVPVTKPRGGGGGGGGGGSGGGLGTIGWTILVGLGLAVLAVALWQFWLLRQEVRPPRAKPQSGASPAPPEEMTRPYDQPMAAWLRRAEELARAGNYLEAVRALYLAVLSLLHRKHLLRVEPTRTNGEYAQQLRRAPEAPPDLHVPFEQLTGLFEVKWYGERACAAAEYAACRGLAEEIQDRTGPA